MPAPSNRLKLIILICVLIGILLGAITAFGDDDQLFYGVSSTIARVAPAFDVSGRPEGWTPEMENQLQLEILHRCLVPDAYGPDGTVLPGVTMYLPPSATYIPQVEVSPSGLEQIKVTPPEVPSTINSINPNAILEEVQRQQTANLKARQEQITMWIDSYLKDLDSSNKNNHSTGWINLLDYSTTFYSTPSGFSCEITSILLKGATVDAETGILVSTPVSGKDPLSLKRKFVRVMLVRTPNVDSAVTITGKRWIDYGKVFLMAVDQ